MASVRKRKGSNVWQAQYYVPEAATGGLRQIRRSPGHTNKKLAKAAAIELECTALGTIEAGTDASRLAKAVLAESVAETERETFSELNAGKHLAQLLALATGEDLKSYTLETWSAEWLRRKARDSSKATMARYKGHLDAASTGWAMIGARVCRMLAAPGRRCGPTSRIWALSIGRLFARDWFPSIHIRPPPKTKKKCEVRIPSSPTCWSFLRACR